ncbi:MAG: hypothetical protein CM15mP46_2260 [Alphaproteobacteria bacterium]|nr:MAG: hypothetical protein CM15mP46_2260 [Alphaproteobacteria bacterium]
MILAAVLATMRLAGPDWLGIQFQSQVFLSVMMLLIGVFVLAMLDRLILPVPGFAHAGQQPTLQRHRGACFG